MRRLGGVASRFLRGRVPVPVPTVLARAAGPHRARAVTVAGADGSMVVAAVVREPARVGVHDGREQMRCQRQARQEQYSEERFQSTLPGRHAQCTVVVAVGSGARAATGRRLVGRGCRWSGRKDPARHRGASCCGTPGSRTATRSTAASCHRALSQRPDDRHDRPIRCRQRRMFTPSPPRPPLRRACRDAQGRPRPPASRRGARPLRSTWRALRGIPRSAVIA